MSWFTKKDTGELVEQPKKSLGPHAKITNLTRGRYQVQLFRSVEHWNEDYYWTIWGKDRAERKARIELAKFKIKLSPETWTIE